MIFEELPVFPGPRSFPGYYVPFVAGSLQKARLLFAELKRRNVDRVGIAYAVNGCVLAQMAEFAFEDFTPSLLAVAIADSGTRRYRYHLD